MKKNLIVTRDLNSYFHGGNNVFLGKYCLDNEKYEIEKERVLDSLWPSYEDLLIASKIANQYYARMLDLLVDSLNDVHLTQYSRKFWEILIGPFLRTFVYTVYDRYCRLNEALKEHNNLELLVYKGVHEKGINDTREFLDLVKYNSSYNLHLVTRIIRIANLGIALKPNLSIKEGRASDKKNRSNNTNNYTDSFIKRGKNFCFDKVNAYCLPRSEIIFYHDGITPLLLMKLMFLLRGKVSCLPSMYNRNSCFNKCNDLRSTLKLELYKRVRQKKDPIFNVLSSVLIEDLPTSFLEGFNHLVEVVKNNLEDLSPKVICSTIGWYYDEVFKFWAGHMVDQGCKLVGIQHGGNYGIFAHGAIGQHEFSICDEFFTWGWTRKDIGVSKPIVSQKFSKKKYPKISKKRVGDGILFCSCNIHNYNSGFFAGSADSNIEYISCERAFFSQLDGKLLPYTRYRSYFYNADMILPYLKEKFPQLKIEDRLDRSFECSISDCSLYVGNTLSTAFLESLNLNKPSILYWNPNDNIVCEEFKHFFELFHELNIIHYSPASAASWVNCVYGNIDGWWHEKERQKAVNDFCRCFANTSSYPAFIWYKSLKSCLN